MLTEYEAGRARARAGQVSPLLTSTLLWFVHRWAHTYLMPDAGTGEGGGVPPSMTLTRFFATPAVDGGGSPADARVVARGGDGVTNFVVEAAAASFVSWPGEAKVVAAALRALQVRFPEARARAPPLSARARAQGLVDNPRTCPVAVACPAWRALVDAYAALAGPAGLVLDDSAVPPSPLASLPLKATRALARLLASAARCCESPEARLLCVREVIAPSISALGALQSLPGFDTRALDPRVCSAIEATFDRLRGVAGVCARARVRWRRDAGWWNV